MFRVEREKSLNLDSGEREREKVKVVLSHGNYFKPHQSKSALKLIWHKLDRTGLSKMLGVNESNIKTF